MFGAMRTIFLRGSAAIVLATLVGCASAQSGSTLASGSLPTAAPEDVGLSSAELARIGPAIQELILLASEADDLVLDPFLGSGTVLEIALELGRNATGFEIDPRYEESIQLRLKRIEKEIGSSKI